MEKKWKALGFLIILLASFGIATSMMGSVIVVEPVAIAPQEVFSLATDGDSQLDAVAANANNITGLTRGDDLLAGAYEEYTIVANASDVDGHGDIDAISISLISGASTNLTTITFTPASGGTFTETTGATLIRLGSATNVSSGNDVDLTVPFAIEWEMGAKTDLDLNITCTDATPGDTEQLNLNLDVIATLTLSDSTLFLFDEYEKFEHFGTMSLTYHYTGYSSVYPLGAETDFWVTRAATPTVQIGERSFQADSYADGTGVATFSSISASDTQAGGHTETWTLFAVDEGGGSSDTSLMATTNTDTVSIRSVAPKDREPRIGEILWPEELTYYVVIFVGIAAVSYYAYQKRSVPKRRGGRRKGRKKGRRGRRK